MTVPASRRWAPLLVVAAVTAPLVGCDVGGARTARAADELAASLMAVAGNGETDPDAEGSADGATSVLPDAERAEVERALAGMGAVDATVSVEGVTPSETTEFGTDVDLSWTWDLPSGRWSYTTRAVLLEGDDGIHASLEPAAVHPDLRDGDVLTHVPLPPDRGDVLGAGGRPIVTERPVLRVGIDKSRLADGDDPARAGELLAAWAGLDDPAAFGGRVTAAGTRQFVEAIVLREEEFPPSPEPLDAIPGAVALPSDRPLAPTSTFARPLLGRVGEATAEAVAESEGRIRPGTLTGLGGLQKRYDTVLAGAPGDRIDARSADGAARALHTAEPVAGEPLHLSLDMGLQILAEDVLADVEPDSAIIAMRASSGEVLAAASGPGSEGRNTATQALPVPGSTMKIATTLALLRAGATPETVLPCTQTLTIEGRRFANNPDYPPSAVGDIPLRDVLAHSCNTALLAQRDRVSAEDLTLAAEALGLGSHENEPGDHGFPYAGASVPPDQEGLEHAASLIGQGRDLASPLAVATSMASVVAGHRVDPVLLRGAEAPVTLVEPERPLTADEAESLRSMLRSVVTEGSSTFLADVPGQPILAKSGTGQYGTEDPPATNAWMVTAQGDLVVVVYVAEGVYGTVTAGPLVETFLRAAPAVATDTAW